ARAGREAPWVMIGPLILLALPAFASGFNFFAKIFVRLPGEQASDWLVAGMALVATLAGIILAIILYRGRESEPVNLAPFRNRFYFDEFYAFLITATQGVLSKIS